MLGYAAEEKYRPEDSRWLPGRAAVRRGARERFGGAAQAAGTDLLGAWLVNPGRVQVMVPSFDWMPHIVWLRFVVRCPSAGIAPAEARIQTGVWRSCPPPRGRDKGKLRDPRKWRVPLASGCVQG